VQQLGDPEAVLVLDETGVLKKGRPSAGGARQYRGTAGQVAHCQMGGLLGSARRLGHPLLDRALYLPEEWTDDRARGQGAGLPADRPFATKPPRARQMLARAFAAGVPAQWGTGDSGDGHDRRLRLWLEAQPQADVLAVSGQASVWLGGQPRRVTTLLAALPDAGWPRHSAGEGPKGPRW
jgi:SRSO17 transposase